MNHLAISQPIAFTTQQGATVQGTVEGRNWSFSTLLSYIVRAADGKRYNVNANDFVAGHSF